MNVGTSGAGEWAKASLVSQPNNRKFCSAARARNYCWIGCLTQDEYVFASAYSIGAACLEPLQHCWALCYPSLLTWYCQCNQSITAFSSRGHVMSSPNICTSWNWLSCLRSPASQLFQVSIFFSLQQVNLPSACSAGVIACNVIDLMTVKMI